MLFSSMTFVFVFMPLVMSIYLLSKRKSAIMFCWRPASFLRLGRASLSGNYDYDDFRYLCRSQAD